MTTLDQLNAMTAADFASALDGIFEHAPWVAATKAFYSQKGQAWPLDSASKPAKKSAAPPLKRR